MNDDGLVAAELEDDVGLVELDPAELEDDVGFVAIDPVEVALTLDGAGLMGVSSSSSIIIVWSS